MHKYEELFVSLRKVTRAIGLYSKKLSKESGLTTPQLIVLKEISQHGGWMVKDIAQSINLSSATVTSILDRLEARNLVIRERSVTDKRRLGLYLTEQGETLVNNAPRPLQTHFIDRFERLQDWEQTQLVSTMQRIAYMMDAENLDAAPMLEVGLLQETTTPE
ncbi:MarR family transcriptional regulator [uncultured Paraglaciecola sp.]|uniref:MarR family winged helix-turn-helix transcriptional regulator n=1 Tax=uncultured Paraglaciecola sp. TaxID=1765024 RepID=UPI0026017F48|nr:MarR family transcriptional regulator [uncultured Paraglaciecola sp.]